jgi:hypothetical protein
MRSPSEEAISMRHLVVGVGLVMLTAGCASGPFGRTNNNAPPLSSIPRAEQVVTHLNHNCRDINAVEFDKVSIQAKQGIQTLGVNGMLAFQKPRNFRMMAEALNTTQADLGSNAQEFWFWFKDGNAPLYRCAHDDLAEAKNIPIPIHPDWIAEALCLQELGSADQYQVRTAGQKMELVSQATSPQGAPLQKVILVDLSGQNAGRITGMRLRNPKGEEVYSSDVTEYQTVSGYTIPRKVTLRCPSQKMELQLKLDGPKVNQLVANNATFQRPGGYQVIDLARAQPRQAAPQSIQRVRGASPQ